MSNDHDRSLNFNRFKSLQRKVITLSQQSLVKISYLNTDEFPLVVEPAVDRLGPTMWAAGAREFIETELLKHGAILFRNFALNSANDFEKFVRAMCPTLLEYQERAAPRLQIAQNIYTSTEYPSEQCIPFHHEMSYSHNWPMKIWFYCDVPAKEGGATPIVNDRVVFDRIDEKIKDTFIRKNVMYTRNYGHGIDITWQDGFQTSEKSEVEAYCRAANIQFEWTAGDRLRTRQVRPAVTKHPRTGETIWFNHAHMFHLSNVEPQLRESLLAELTEEYLPRNSYYGDGTRIETSVLDEIRQTYIDAAVTIPWCKGDVLMLDNVLASHGRQPFVGPRKILVALAELHTSTFI
jgi:alpha-ketoglutarate-dependent taurine dioxygenase